MDLTEAEDIKKRWQESIEELYKQHLNDSGNQEWGDHSPRTKHLGVGSQVGLRKHHHEQS